MSRRFSWAPTRLTYTVATKSDVGMRRKVNQDASGVLRLRKGCLALVCDGMGGFEGGEVASRMTVSSILQFFKSRSIPGPGRLRRFLAKAIAWSNREVWEYAQSHARLQRMGTTVVAVLCYREKAYIAHVGDSRVYLLRDDVLVQLTKDHSKVQRMLDAGEISEETAAEHPQSNVISRVIGQRKGVDVESMKLPLQLAPGDRLLLCSDGLFRMVDDIDILYQLRDGTTPEAMCNNLVDMANRAGGKDNVTAQIIECKATSSSEMWLRIAVFSWLTLLFVVLGGLLLSIL
ncbi:MAG: Stp1/IreP family PP2C-type Ser/Thr phosphatase [Deltaproteobacteria bacterium]|nr:MAG: Stp1/IreP family PP2C-type Ser/Thr phosphatase [Deltaproteobacteria bacterium]